MTPKELDQALWYLQKLIRNNLPHVTFNLSDEGQELLSVFNRDAPLQRWFTLFSEDLYRRGLSTAFAGLGFQVWPDGLVKVYEVTEATLARGYDLPHLHSVRSAGELWDWLTVWLSALEAGLRLQGVAL